MGKNTDIRDASDNLRFAGVHNAAQGLTFTYSNYLSPLHW